jgi:hypothetical protein
LYNIDAVEYTLASMEIRKYPWHNVCLKLLLVLNLFDAVCTYIWVVMGYANEANPLMDYVLSISPTGFVLYKIIIVNLGVLLLWRLRRKIFCRAITVPVVGIYIGIAFIHAAFIVRCLFGFTS